MGRTSRVWAAAVLALALATSACTTTNERVAGAAQEAGPPANAVILVVTPDVQLAELSLAGLPEPKADWSQSARDNFTAAMSGALTTRGHNAEAIDLDAYMSGRPGQVLRLHEAVGASIGLHSYGIYRLPTKGDSFDWTLGDGAQEIAALAQGDEADYALFLTARGTFSSSARMAGAIGMALLGVSVPMGGQQVYASLVNLETGDIVWFNVSQAGSGVDMRTPEGAASLIETLLKSAPL